MEKYVMKFQTETHAVNSLKSALNHSLDSYICAVESNCMGSCKLLQNQKTGLYNYADHVVKSLSIFSEEI